MITSGSILVFELSIDRIDQPNVTEYLKVAPRAVQNLNLTLTIVKIFKTLLLQSLKELLLNTLYIKNYVLSQDLFVLDYIPKLHSYNS